MYWGIGVFCDYLLNEDRRSGFFSKGDKEKIEIKQQKPKRKILKMKYKIYFSWVAVIFWMAVIFVLSSQGAESSDKLSKSIAENVMVVAEKDVPTWNISIKKLNYIVRKNAHFFSYFVLEVLMVNALRASSVYGRRGIFLAVLMCICMA